MKPSKGQAPRKEENYETIYAHCHDAFVRLYAVFCTRILQYHKRLEIKRGKLSIDGKQSNRTRIRGTVDVRLNRRSCVDRGCNHNRSVNR